MNAFLNIWLLMLFISLLPSYIISQHETNTSVQESEKTQLKVWDMAKEFGEKNKVVSWIFYFEHRSWEKTLKQILKDRTNEGLFGFDANSSKSIGDQVEKFKSSSRATLHIFDHSDLGALKQQITNGNNSTFNGFKNYFLIHIPVTHNNRTISSLSSSNQRQKISNYFKSTPLSYNSLTFAFVINKKNGGIFDTIDIYDVYKINSSTENVEVQGYGNWSEANGLIISNKAMWKRRGELMGYHIRAGAAYYPNFCLKIIDGCQKPECFQGIGGDIWNTLQRLLNFTYTIQENTAWGAMENNSWDGMIGKLIKNDIDIAVSDFTITSDRSEVVDFLPVLVESYAQVFIKNPSDTLNWMAYLKPITGWAWLGIFAFIVLAPPIICCILFYGREPVQDELQLSDCYCFAYKTVLMQSWNKTPDSFHNRIAFVCIMLAGTLIYWHWEAMMITFLAVRTIVVPYNSFEQLLSKSGDKVVTKRGIVYGDMLRYAKDPTLKKVYSERMEAEFENYPTTDVEMIKMVLAGGYAAFDSSSGWKTRAQYLQCKIIDLPIAYSEQLAYAMQKDSPFYWAFHYHINKIKESGSLKQIVNKYSSEKQVCPDPSGEPLDLKQCFTAFIIMAIGGGVAVVSFGLEVFIPRKWFKPALTFCDRKFEKLLGGAERKQSKRIRSPLGDDGPKYVARIRQPRTEKKYFEELEKMSRFALIGQVKLRERQKKKMWKRNKDLEQLITGGKGELLINDDKPNQHLIKLMNKYEKHIISQQFDHAFQLTESKLLNKTFHIPE